MDALIRFAGVFRVGSHATLADDDLHASLFHKFPLKFLHTHAGSWAHRDHLEFIIPQRSDDGAGMEDCCIAYIHRKRTSLFDQTTMRHIAAGSDVSGQIDDITNMNIFQIRVTNGCFQNLFPVFHLYHYKVTPECVVIT